MAYCLEAFACHFLTDLFSSGHLRTPRRALHTPNQASDLCAQRMHDEDSYNGLSVQNAAGASWTAYGDKRLNDTVNTQNFGIARQVVQMSLNEVINALKTKSPTPVFGALNLIPQLDAVNDRTNPNNWSPLFVLDSNNAPKVRDTLDDLTCRAWTSSFSYISTYGRTGPSGVHSVTGMPPRQGFGLVHAITWQSHRLVGSGEQDLAPAASIVTNATPGLLNTTPTNDFDSSLAPPSDLNPALQNTLCVAYRKTSSDDSNHHIHFLAVPMTDAPAFKTYTATDITLGGKILASDGGNPALVAVDGDLVMIYPDGNGTLHQTSWSSSLKTWSTASSATQPTALSSTDSANFKLLAPPGNDAGPCVSLCNVSGSDLYMVFPTRSSQNGGNIVFCRWNASQNGFSTPSPVVYVGASGSLVASKTNLNIGFTEFGDALLIAYADANANNHINLLRYIGSDTWNSYPGPALDTAGKAITTHSALSLVTYGGALMMVVNDSNGNIFTYVYRELSGNWAYTQLQGVSNDGTTVAPYETKYALSPVSFGGNAYVVYTDKAKGVPSVMTTAVVATAS